MKKKTFFKILFWILYSVIMLGYVAPTLVSLPNTIFVIIGFLLVSLPILFYLYKYLVKE